MADSTGSRRERAILLNAAQAEQVRGVTTPGHALDPVRIGDDQYILSANVLSDQHHAKHIPFLMELPQCELFEGSLTVIPETIAIPDNRPREYVPSVNPWDPPPFPDQGEWNEGALYEAIGRALTAWEIFEQSFAELYEAFLSPTLYSLPARRAYGSILTFKGRSEMVEAAAAAYFLAEPAETLQKKLRSLMNQAGRYSGRRNEIAHGIVRPYPKPPDGGQIGLALLPSDYATKKQELRRDIDVKVAWAAKMTQPRYAYTIPELTFFTLRFRELATPTSEISHAVFRFFER